MLSCILLLGLTGCDDKDYSDDIDALKKELAETKAAIKTLQDLTNALQNQLSIDSYGKTDNGYILEMSDGSKITVTQGEKGENGKDAPVITNINETEDSLEFIFSNGNTITLPKNEKCDVITLNLEITNAGGHQEFDFLVFNSYYLGTGPLFSFPENLEINWGDNRITGSCNHKYEAVGTYAVSIKAKQIYGLRMNDIEKASNIDVSKCSNIQYLDLSRCKGDITVSNSKSLVEIDAAGNSKIIKLNLENLPNLRYINISSFDTENSQLEVINITNCPKIEILDITSTKLTSIDVSELTNLYELRCGDSITTIWVWEGFNPANYSNWSVPEGVNYKVKQ